MIGQLESYFSDVVGVFMDEQEDNTPLVVDGDSSNSFTGFRITPL